MRLCSLILFAIAVFFSGVAASSVFTKADTTARATPLLHESLRTPSTASVIMPAPATQLPSAAPQSALPPAVSVSQVPPPATAPTPTRSPEPSATASAVATAHAHVSGAWRHYVDVWALAAQVPGVTTSTQMLNHERNLDFGAFLYVEDNLNVFVDAAGPVCLTHSFFALSASLDVEANYKSTELHVDTGSGWKSIGTIGDIFVGDYAADLYNGDRDPGGPRASAFSTAERPKLSPSEGWGSGLPALPRPLVFNTERSANLRSGFTLTAPVCAHTRLRIAWHFKWMPQEGSLALQQGSDCVAQNTACETPQYTNPALIKFPGTTLPPGVTPFDATVPAFSTADALALPALAHDVERVWSPARLIDEARAGGDAARSVRRCGRIGDGAKESREWAVLSETGRPGTISLLWVDFPDAPYLLHSSHVWIEASWDDGRGKLRVNLEGLLGPGAWTSNSDRDGPIVRKEGLYVGELPRGNLDACRLDVAANASPLDAKTFCTGGFYITLPMGWSRAADVRVVYTGDAAELGDSTRKAYLDRWEPAPWPPHDRRLAADAPPLDSVTICTAAVVARDDVAAAEREGAAAALGGGDGPPPAVGYLQAAYASSRQAGTNMDVFPGGVLANITGASGSLAFFSVYLHCGVQFCTEGDLRIWTDGRHTPSQWSSGFEDFFGGAHSYAFRPHHLEPFYAWDRRFGVDSGAKSTQYYQARSFGFDSPRFQHSLLAAIESIAEGSPMYARATTLFYGLPAGAPVVTDTLHPAALLGAAASPGEVKYEVRARADGGSAPQVTTQNMTSVIPSRGELAAGGTPLFESALAISGAATVAFTVRVDPAARSVVLRRLFDIRRAVARATVRVDGVVVGFWLTADRAFDTIDAHWQEDDFAIPLEATLGRSSVRVELDVDAETDSLWSKKARTYLRHQLPPAWSEARYTVLCFPAL